MAGRSSLYLSFLILIFCLTDVFAQFPASVSGSTSFPPNISQSNSAENNRGRFRLVGSDKVQHFMASLISTVFVYKFSEVRLHMKRSHCKQAAVGFSLSVGIFKEIRDSRQPKNVFSWRDLLADVAGIGVGLVLINQP